GCWVDAVAVILCQASRWTAKSHQCWAFALNTGIHARIVTAILTCRRSCRIDVPAGKAQAGSELRCSGTAYGNQVPNRPIQFDHRSLAFLADESDMRDGNDVAAVNPHEEGRVEIFFRFRNGPG